MRIADAHRGQRLRDKDGDLWERLESGCLVLSDGGRELPEGEQVFWSVDVADRDWGPFSAESMATTEQVAIPMSDGTTRVVLTAKGVRKLAERIRRGPGPRSTH